MPLSKAGAFFSSVTLLWGLAAAQEPGSNCTALLQAGDAKAVAACKAQVDEAESGPATERMARIVGDDEYGVALLAIAHQPKQALDAFDTEIALLPASTVKPDSLQWAVAFWHRATAYQQLDQWEQSGRRSGNGGSHVDQGHCCCRRECTAGTASHATAPGGPGAACGRAGAPGQAQRSAKHTSYTIVLLTGGYVSATPGCSSGIINL